MLRTLCEPVSFYCNIIAFILKVFWDGEDSLVGERLPPTLPLAAAPYCNGMALRAL